MSSDSSSGPVVSVQAPAVPYETLMGILWSGTALSWVVLLFRLGFRLKIFGRLKLDDYFVIGAAMLYLASTLTWTVLAKMLYLTLDNVANPNLEQLLDLMHKAATALHGNLASYLCTWTCLYLIKLSFMAFFRGLGRQIRSQQILWWCVLVFIGASYATTIGLMDYKCLTSVGVDMIENCRTQKVIDFEFVTTRVQTTLDIVTDALIVLVSGNIVWRVSMAWKKKLLLTGICCLTIAMVVVAIIRIVIGSPGKVPDLTWLLLWNSVEMTIAIHVACVASFRSLYSHTKNTQLQDSLALQQRSGHSGAGILKSGSVTDTMVSAEYSLWDRQASHGSQESLWATHVVEVTGPRAPVFHP